MFGALPTVADMEISPNGRMIGALQHMGRDVIVAFYDLDNPGPAPKATRIENALARSLYWANDDTLLVMVSQSRRRETDQGMEQLEAFRWLAISHATMKSSVLFGNEPGYYLLSPGNLLSTLPDDPAHVLFSRWTSHGDLSHPVSGSLGSRLRNRPDVGGAVSLLKLRIEDGRITPVERGTPDTSYWVIDRSGTALARVDAAEPKATEDAAIQNRIYTRKSGASSLSLARTIEEKRGEQWTLRLRGQSAISGEMLATTHIGDTLSLVRFDLDTGETGEPVFHSERYDIDGALYDSRIAAVRGVAYTDDMPRRRYFDPEDQNSQDMLSRALPEAAPVIWSRSADEKRFIVRVYYTDHPPQWFLFDRNTKELSMVGASYQALDGRPFAKKEKYDYRASDGLTIPGYLTVPNGADRSKAMPLVVLPHGGPWARDDQTFDWWPFFYAARGYLVYQPNFRGSDGYGARFRHAGDGEWGRKMQDDISEGVLKLIEDGQVDPSRICIVGGSYGGYAALAGATLTPHLYACAVAVNGVSNLSDLISQGSRSYWQARIGSRFDREALRAVSPLHQAHRARAPILLIHARDDTVVPARQSQLMARALAEHKKPHEFVELRGEDHWLSTGETRIEMLARSIEFIDRYIGAGAPAAAAGN